MRCAKASGSRDGSSSEVAKPSHRVLLAAGPGVKLYAQVADDGAPAEAGALDPIFAAIDCHKAAAKANELAQRRADARETQANKHAADRASDADTAAMLALIATVPTTASGLRAGLRYVAANGFEGNDLAEFIRTLLHSHHSSTASA
jgi:hypothetical protein